MPSSEVFQKFKKRALHSGSPTGPVVTNPRQAVAIKMSEEQAEKKNGGTYPERGAKESGKDKLRKAMGMRY